MSEAQVVFLTELEVADLLGYHPGTLANWRSQGVGPPYLKLRTGAIRYDQIEVIAWAQQERVDPSASTAG